MPETADTKRSGSSKLKYEEPLKTQRSYCSIIVYQVSHFDMEEKQVRIYKKSCHVQLGSVRLCDVRFATNEQRCLGSTKRMSKYI